MLPPVAWVIPSYLQSYLLASVLHSSKSHLQGLITSVQILWLGRETALPSGLPLDFFVDLYNVSRTEVWKGL